jgi:hypothetical protein
MVGNHELEEKHIGLAGRRVLELIYLLWRCHPWHQSLCLVTHPSHGGFCPGGRQAQGLEPAPHPTDLSLLAQGDLGGKVLDQLVVGAGLHDLGHLNGLGVVDHHVSDETRFRRVRLRRVFARCSIVRRPAEEEQRERHGHTSEESDSESQQNMDCATSP